MALRTIVVVEDDSTLRLDLIDVFEAAGLDVAGFESGDDALDYIREHRDEVAGVFTDVRLATQTDGFAIARLVAGASPGMGVVVTSGYWNTRPAGLPDSARFLPKPWQALDVLNAMVDGAQER